MAQVSFCMIDHVFPFAVQGHPQTVPGIYRETTKVRLGESKDISYETQPHDES